MTDTKKRAHIVLAIAAALQHGISRAQTSTWPAGPIKLIVPWPPGGSQDLVSRLLAEKVAIDLGHPVVVENRPGAGGVIGAHAAARARADGYTVLQMSLPHVTAPLLQDNVPYDWARDFSPIFGTHEVPFLLFVSGKSEIRSIVDLVAASKAAPAGLSYSSGGAGVGLFLSAFLAQSLQINATHIPYRGIADATQAVLADQVQFSFASVNEVSQFAQAGRVRLLALASDQRLTGLPNVPTLKELGAPVSGSSWTTYAAPAKTPAEVVDRLQKAFTKAARDPAVQERLSKVGMELRLRDRAELGRFMQDESVKWQRVINDNKIRLTA